MDDIEQPDALEALLERAFRSGDACRANVLIDEVRCRISDEHGQAANYEVALAGRGAEYLQVEVAPRLAFYLRNKRLRVESCAPVFLSIFHGATLYFVAAPVFYDWVQSARGWTNEAFAAISARWEETGRGALAALPAGAEEER